MKPMSDDTSSDDDDDDLSSGSGLSGTDTSGIDTSSMSQSMRSSLHRDKYGVRPNVQTTGASIKGGPPWEFHNIEVVKFEANYLQNLWDDYQCNYKLDQDQKRADKPDFQIFAKTIL